MVAGAVLLVAMELMPQVEDGPAEAVVTLRQQGADGQPGQEVAKLYMDEAGALRAAPGGRGAVLGQKDPSGAIMLNPAGEAYLRGRAARPAQPPPAPPPAAGSFPGGTYDAMGNWTGPGDPALPVQPAPAPQPAPDGTAAIGDEPRRPGTSGLPQTPPPGQELQRQAWMDELNGIETHSDEEREFIEGLARQGAKRDEIIRQLEKLRQGGFRSGDRNRGLRDALQTDSGRARNNAFRADAEIQQRLAAGTVTSGELRAHHLATIQALRDFPSVFGPAADAGWEVDGADNTILLPADADVQRRLAEGPNPVDRPIHDDGNNHPNFRREVLREAQRIQQELNDEGNVFGTPEYAAAARRKVEDMVRRLRGGLPHDRLTMRETEETGVG